MRCQICHNRGKHVVRVDRLKVCPQCISMGNRLDLCPLRWVVIHQASTIASHNSLCVVNEPGRVVFVFDYESEALHLWKWKARRKISMGPVVKRSDGKYVIVYLEEA